MDTQPTLTLPGEIAWLIREFSPVVAFGVLGVVLGRDTREKRHGDWTVAPVDEWPDGSEWADMARSCRLDEMALRLTNATGRAHAAWWLMSRMPLARSFSARMALGEWGDEIRRAMFADTGMGMSLGGLDPDDPRTLPDGSRWVDAEWLRLVVLHIGDR